MKRNVLMTLALAGLITASLTTTARADESTPPPERPERAQIRERRHNAAPEDLRAIREWMGDATPEQRRAAREQLRRATPERRQAVRERFRNASPEERQAMLDRFAQPRQPEPDAARPARARPESRNEARLHRGPGGQDAGRGPAAGAGGPPSPERREGVAQQRQERLQNRLTDLREELAKGNLGPDEQRQLARLENWDKSSRREGGAAAGRGPGRDPGGPGGPGRRGPGPRPGGNAPTSAE